MSASHEKMTRRGHWLAAAGKIGPVFALWSAIVACGPPRSYAQSPQASSWQTVVATDGSAAGYGSIQDGFGSAGLGPKLPLFDAYTASDCTAAHVEPDGPWSWQLLPDGFIYRSYMAGAKEPRIAGHFFHEKDLGWQLDVTLGGRVGIVRYGTRNALWPEGWQLDLEGAAFPRLNLEEDWDMDVADFRFGIPLTYGVGPWQYKLAYYHLSSHLGDELLERMPALLASRNNFSRDVLVLGSSHYITPALRLYGEAAWAMASDGGSKPWEFQFGMDYGPAIPQDFWGAPFFAVNGHLRQEVDFGGNLVVQMGWMWRGESGQVFRIGLHYLNGKTNQFEIFDMSEEQVGIGLWYDF